MNNEDVRNTILHLDDRPREPVDVSEFWPSIGTVYISVMQGLDRDRYEWLLSEAYEKKDDVTALLLVRCITDESGNRIFTDEDAPALSVKNWKALDKLWNIARRVNRLSPDELKGIEKNSGTPDGNDS